jgi:hypothetical protein
MIYNLNDQLTPNKPLIPLNLSKVLYITIHNTDSNPDYTWEQCNADHKNNGWDCLGYNELIYKNGDVFICRGDNIGAHTLNMNSKSYGIAVVGNYNKEKTMPLAQFQALVERIMFNKKRFENFLSVEPHSKFVATDCPGKLFNFKELLTTIEKLEKKYDDFPEDVAFLASKGIITTAKYWTDNINGSVKGDYVKQLIKNMSKYVRSVK